MAACSSLKQMFVVTAFNNSYWLTIQGCNITDENAKMWIAPCSCWAYTRLDVEQRFSVPVFSIPNPVLRLSSLGTRFRFWFRDCPWLEHDSESGSETARAWNSIPIPVPRLHRLGTRFRFRFWDCTGLELDSDSEKIPSLDPRVLAFRFWFQIFHLKRALFG